LTYSLVVDVLVDGASVSGVVTVSGKAPGFVNVEVEARAVRNGKTRPLRTPDTRRSSGDRS